MHLIKMGNRTIDLDKVADYWRMVESNKDTIELFSAGGDSIVTFIGTEARALQWYLDERSEDVMAAWAGGLMMQGAPRNALLAIITELAGAIDEAHAALMHYDLTQRAGGVEWGPVEELQTKLVDRLWGALLIVRPELKPREER